MPVRAVYGQPPTAVRFLGRPNRFLAVVRRLGGGPEFEAHVPNPGRMEELLVPGETVGWIVAAAGPARRTQFDLVSVRHGRSLVSIDTRMSNRLMGRALVLGALRLGGVGPWRAEVPWGRHRFDFARIDPTTRSPTALLEVKSSNLRVGHAVYFPDAPTDRGREHVRELARASRRGIPSLLVFIVQRADVSELRPNRALDPAFTRAVRSAAIAGVRFRAFRVRVRPAGITLDRELPVVLS